MPYFEVLQHNLNVAPIVADLASQPELWNSVIDRRREGIDSPHMDAPDIWIRYNDYSRIKNRASFNDEHVPVWYPSWYKLPSLKPIIFDLMAKVEGEMLGGVLITKVPAGKKILPHIDKGWHVDYYDKFYIQLAGSPGCSFCCDADDGTVEQFTPLTGDLYLFDNRKRHWVNNDSDMDRMTLIVCIRTGMFGRA